MSSDTRDLRSAWRALAGGRTGEGWRTIAIGGRAPCVVMAGRRLPGDEEALLVEFRRARTVPDSHLPQGHGFEVAQLGAGSAGVRVALARRPGGNVELFAMMADDIVQLLEGDSSDDDQALLRRFLARIRAWQDFMDRHRADVLSPEAEVGLFGELVLIEQLIALGVPAAMVLESWQGPLDAPQDFALGGGGIEVKTTLSPVGFPANISSLEQLDDGLRSPLFIAAVRLALDPNGAALPTKAAEIRERLRNDSSALDVYESRLVQAGLLPAVADRYTRTFVCAAIAILPILGGFPRLARSRIHPAIGSARYTIDLELAGVSDIGLSPALEQLGVI